MRTPLVNAFIFGSEAYYDYYRWPVKDRRIFEQWLEHPGSAVPTLSPPGDDSRLKG
jgi:hypothetical protein